MSFILRSADFADAYIINNTRSVGISMIWAEIYTAKTSCAVTDFAVNSAVCPPSYDTVTYALFEPKSITFLKWVGLFDDELLFPLDIAADNFE